MQQKIQTLHPTKTGRIIDINKYEPIKEAMLSVLKNKELTHDELMAAMDKKLKGKFEGNIGWYSETVKLDLEARKIIERLGKGPQRYKLTL